LEKDVFPWIGKKDTAQITAPEVLTVIRRIKDRGVLETAHRAMSNCGQVFRYGVQTGKCERDVTYDLRGALPQPIRGHMASLTEPKDVRRLLQSFDDFTGSYPVQCALKLSVMWFVRPSELRTARWADFDLENGEWRFVVSKTKTPHIVPLSTQAIAILNDLRALTGHFEYVFAINKDAPMSNGTINKALRRLGWNTKTEYTGHGARSMARTILAERLKVQPEIIEHQLAHRVPDSLGTAYNRTKYLDDRKHMMQSWSDYLDELKASATVIKMWA
jgi:integrase